MPNYCRDQAEEILRAVGCEKKKKLDDEFVFQGFLENVPEERTPSGKGDTGCSNCVVTPFWSKSADLDEASLHMHVIPYYFGPGDFESCPVRNGQPTYCEYCGLSKMKFPRNPNTSRVDKFSSGPLAIQNPHLVFHSCELYRDRIIDKSIGIRTKTTEKSTAQFNRFIFAQRPPDVSVVLKEVEEHCKDPNSVLDEPLRSPNYDARNPNYDARSPNYDARSPNYEARSPVLTPKHIVSNKSEIINMAGHLYEKSRKLTDVSLDPSIRGSLGTIMFIEVLLDLKLEADSGTPVERIGNVFRDEGFVETDAILGILVCWRPISALEQTRNSSRADTRLYVTRKCEDFGPNLVMESEGEIAAMEAVLDFIVEIDPSIITGWNIKNGSLG